MAINPANEGREKTLNHLASSCILGKDQDKYQVDENNFEKLVAFVKPYLSKAVYHSTKQNNPELINELSYHAFRLLEAYGATPNGMPFSAAYRLRISNILTNNYRRTYSRSQRAQVFNTDSPELFDAFGNAQQRFEDTVESLERRDIVSNLLKELTKREKLFVECFIEFDGDFTKISEATGYSSCFIRKVLKKIGESNSNVVSEVSKMSEDVSKDFDVTQDSTFTIPAKDAIVGQTYLSRGGREVTVVSKQEDRITVKVHITGNTVLVPADYEFLSPDSLENQMDSEVATPPEQMKKHKEKELEVSSTPSSDEKPSENFCDSQEIPESPKDCAQRQADDISQETQSLTERVAKTSTVKDAIYVILESGDAYSVDELAKLTNSAKTTVRLKISELRRVDGVKFIRANKKYRISK